MEVSVRELIRETKNAVNARFDMLEQVLTICKSESNDNSKLYDIVRQQNDEIDSIKTMMYRFNDLIANIMRKIETMEQKPIVSPLPSLNERMPKLYITPKPQLSARSHYDNDDEDSLAKNACSEDYCDDCGGDCDEVHAESGEKALIQLREQGLDIVDDKILTITIETEEEVVEKEAEEEQVEEQVEEEAEEEVVEEQVEEEAEEEGIELEEFEYKGMTLYRDTENKVYRMDEDGALSDPLGLWDEAKQRIKKL